VPPARRWLAFIDSDEFIVMHDTQYAQDINGFMRQYEQYGALAVNWVLLGSGGHKDRPPGGSLVNYVKCMPRDNPECTHVKVRAGARRRHHPSARNPAARWAGPLRCLRPGPPVRAGQPAALPPALQAGHPWPPHRLPPSCAPQAIANTKYLAGPAGHPHAVVFNNASAQLVTEDFTVLKPRAARTEKVSVSRCAAAAPRGGGRGTPARGRSSLPAHAASSPQ
jgi:hypothetical protein